MFRKKPFYKNKMSICDGKLTEEWNTFAEQLKTYIKFRIFKFIKQQSKQKDKDIFQSI